MAGVDTSGLYGSSPIKRKRRTRAEVDLIMAAILDLLHEDNPMTVRQVFYRLVSQRVIEKTEQEYDGTVVRLLTRMRTMGLVPYEWIADNTRWQRKPKTYHSLDGMLNAQIQFYRRALWDEQEVYVEFWLEKDALAGVMYEITAPWDVPLMVARGFSSLSYLYEAAEAIKAAGKPACLYYFGDHDPSGVMIPLTIERRLREMAPDCDIQFSRVAVNPDQIEAMGLPTRPTKKNSSHFRGFEGESVEVDAIPPPLLRDMAAALILAHIDPQRLARTKQVEDLERETLRTLVGRMRDGSAG
jgi:hypothetical protein